MYRFVQSLYRNHIQMQILSAITFTRNPHCGPLSTRKLFRFRNPHMKCGQFSKKAKFDTRVESGLFAAWTHLEKSWSEPNDGQDIDGSLPQARHVGTCARFHPTRISDKQGYLRAARVRGLIRKLRCVPRRWLSRTDAWTLSIVDLATARRRQRGA